MRFLMSCLMLGLSGLAAHAAEITTYAGTLGKARIVVELSEPFDNGRVIGRYAYLKKGIDIPLSGNVGKAGVALSEEAPCTVKLCASADETLVSEPPIGADWTLEGDTGDAQLVGEWLDRASGKSLKLVLERKGSRQVELYESSKPDTLDPQSSLYEGSGVAATPANFPYDFIRMAEKMTVGPETRTDAGIWRPLTDPRTEMSYPEIVAIEGVSDLKPLSEAMTARRLSWNLYGFSCLSKAYLGFGWMTFMETPSTGMDGGGSAEVEYMSDRLVGLHEAGSYFCGGAHPYNFSNHDLYDVRTGEKVELERFLKGWVAKDYTTGAVVDPETAEPDTFTWGPDDSLVAFAKAHRIPPEAGQDEECRTDELMSTRLGVYLRGDKLVFWLADLEHVIFACTQDVAEVPIREAGGILTDAGKRYFAELSP